MAFFSGQFAKIVTTPPLYFTRESAVHNTGSRFLFPQSSVDVVHFPLEIQGFLFAKFKRNKYITIGIMMIR